MSYKSERLISSPVTAVHPVLSPSRALQRTSGESETRKWRTHSSLVPRFIAMGGDGGSIPARDDLVRTRAKTPPKDTQLATRQSYSLCRLSNLPLVAPIVADKLGRLYNKTAILQHLLNPELAGHDQRLIASHITSLKQLTTLHLTPNPAFSLRKEQDSFDHIGSTQSRPTAPFICPISMREMNGSVRFFYRIPGGSVISEASLREMRKGLGDAEDESVDPVTGIRDQEGNKERFITINPKSAELAEMTERMEVELELERTEKLKAKILKKRKNGDSASSSLLTSFESVPSKKVKKSMLAPDAIPLPTTSILIPSLSKTLATRMEKEKQGYSAAVKGLYAKRDGTETHDKDGRSNWMTRGAFTRYA